MSTGRSQIFLEGLAVTCRIGVPEEERAKPQELWLDVELEVSVPFGQNLAITLLWSCVGLMTF